MNIKRKFTLTPNETKEAFDFAEQMYSKDAQSSRDFGSNLYRKKLDRVVDCAEGKIGELAFKKFLDVNFGLNVDLDFEIYPDKEQVDNGGDIQYVYIESEKNKELSRVECPIKIDVKSTRFASKWLLVEEAKLGPSIYVLVKVGFPEDSETTDRLSFLKSSDIDVEIVGFCSREDLFNSKTNKPWLHYSGGEYLLDPLPLFVVAQQMELTYDVLDFNFQLMKKMEDTYALGIKKLSCPSNIAMPVAILDRSNSDWEYLKDLIIGKATIREGKNICERIMEEVK